MAINLLKLLYLRERLSTLAIDSTVYLYRSIDECLILFRVTLQCDGWINEAGQFLLNVGRKATECKSSKDAANLIDQLNNFKEEGGAQQNERLNGMERIATALYGKNSAILT